MVHISSLDCPEQIVVPENFSEILKNYAKAALRTQPYDLLNWSATYFRCLQMGIPPPVKCHYEHNVKHGSVTKEYLRVLIKQVGKGFFISRSLVFQRWEGLCLPQDELLKYLSLCRMLHWPQIHWLKLLVVIVGFMNQTFPDTMIMLCELLTDNVEGAEAYIPMWIFQICYSFLADLDCSEEQKFIDGRKLLANGELEEEIRMKAIPEICLPAFLRKTVLEECRNRYIGRSNNERKEENTMNSDTNSVSKDTQAFEFSWNEWELKQINGRCDDFDSIILLLREVQVAKMHEYEGLMPISQNEIRHAKNKKNKINEESNKQAEMYEINTRHELFEQQMKMLKEVGPRWTWLHEFASGTHCIDKTYNFIETESIASTEITPASSSDQSFDFEREKTIADVTSEESDDAITVISIQESSAFSEQIEKLLSDNSKKIKIVENEERDALEPCFEHLRSILMQVQLEGEDGNVATTESVITFLRKEAADVMKRPSEKVNQKVDLLEVASILEKAYQRGIIFENLDKMIDYITKQYLESKTEATESSLCEISHIDFADVTKKVKEKNCKATDTSVCSTDQIIKNGSENENWTLTLHIKNTRKENTEFNKITEISEAVQIDDKRKNKVTVKKSINLEISGVTGRKDESHDKNSDDEGEEKHIISRDSSHEVNLVQKTNIPHIIDENKGGGEIVTKDKIEQIEEYTKKDVENMRKVLEESGIEADEKLVDEIINEKLILGLVEKSDSPDFIEEISEEIEVSELTTDLSMVVNIQDNSSLQPSMTAYSQSIVREEANFESSVSRKYIKSSCERKIRPKALECTIPPIKGIGGKVSKETVQDFLTYLKGKSVIQNGMICPRNFKEHNCPNIIDSDI